MSSTTVAEFAAELKKSTDTLLEQLKSAGVAKSAATDTLNDADKQKLLGFLQASHGTSTQERKKITLVKKSTSEIKQADSSGKARTIQVEVRKKRTFVKREDGVEVPVDQPEQFAAATPAAPLIDDAELARREEEARRQAELLRRQEEELSERRRQREEQEARERQAAEQAAAAALAAEQAAQASKASAQVPETVGGDDVADAQARTSEQDAKAAAAAAAAERDKIHADAKAAASAAGAQSEADR